MTVRNFAHWPLTEWERDFVYGPEEAIGDVITVNDLEGFLTLPTTAVLEDPDGDTWTYRRSAGMWAYAGDIHQYTPKEIFEMFSDRDDKLGFEITNPEVLNTPPEVVGPVGPIFALDQAGLTDLPDQSVVIAPAFGSEAWTRYQGEWRSPNRWSRTSKDLIDLYGHVLVAYVPGDIYFP